MITKEAVKELIYIVGYNKKESSSSFVKSDKEKDYSLFDCKISNIIPDSKKPHQTPSVKLDMSNPYPKTERQFLIL